MKFIFDESLPSDSKGYYFNYANQNLQNSEWIYLDAKKFILTNQESLFSDIEKWHSSVASLGSMHVSRWWQSPASRLLSWSPPIYQPILFCISICELVKNLDANEIYILNATQNVKNYLEEFTRALVVESKLLSSENTKKNFLNEYVRPYIGYIRNHLHDIKSTVPVSIKKQNKFLVFSQVLNSANVINLSDHFYGDIFFSLNNRDSSSVQWLYYYPENHSKIKNQIRNAFKKRNITVNFTHDYLNLVDVLKIFLRSITHRIQMHNLCSKLPALKVSTYLSCKFLETYKSQILRQGQSILAELEIEIAFNKITKLGGFEKILYPYEEKSIERSILKYANPPIISFGFVHAAMHPGHLCFDFKSIPSATPPRPNVILVTGEAPRKWFTSKGYTQDSVQILGSPRAEQNINKKKFQNNLRILFIVSQPHELNALAEIIEKKPSVVSRFQLTIRKYPYASLEEQNAGFRRLARIIPNIKDEGGSLASQVNLHDIVMFSTSSGGIEAIFHGALALYVSLDQVFNLNPLQILSEQKSIPQIVTIEELEKHLKIYESLDQESFETLQKNQAKVASEIYKKTNVAHLFKN